MATFLSLDILRLVGSPAKSRRKVGERISCLVEGVCTIGLYVSRLPSEQVHSSGRGEIGIESHRHILKGRMAPRKNSEKKGSIARSHMQKCKPQERNPCAKNFEERTQDETLQQEKCARREAWDLAKNDYKLKKSEAWVMLVPFSKKAKGTRSRGRFRSINACAEQKGFKLRRTGTPSKIQKPHNGGIDQWSSANERGS